MKKHWLILLGILMIGAFSLTGCRNDASSAGRQEVKSESAAEETATKSEYSGEGYKFALVAHLASNEWQRLLIQGYTDVIEAAGGEVIITDAQGDLQKQAEDLISILPFNPDVIVINPCDPSLMQRGVDMAADKGIPIIAAESYVRGSNVITSTYADQMINGIKNANNIIDYLAITHDGRAVGNILNIHSPGNATLDIREEAMRFKLDTYDDINVIATLPYDETNIIEDTRAKVESYLQANADKVNLVTAHFGEPMVGATLAIDGLGLGNKIKVVGIDAFEPVLNLMRTGETVIAAVQQDGYAMGNVVGQLALMYVNGERDFSYQYLFPLTDVYANFPGKIDNYPASGNVSISSPPGFKEMGLDWGY